MTKHPKTRTLLFAVGFPDTFDPEEVEPEDIADELVAMINEERARNGGYGGAVTVSAIPSAQWMTARTMKDMSEALQRYWEQEADRD